MMNHLKLAAFGAIAALGLTSAAVAQPSGTQRPAAERPMDHQRMDQGSMMGMMNDPEMRRQMTEMMSNCNMMMARMGDMPSTGEAPRSR